PEQDYETEPVPSDPVTRIASPGRPESRQVSRSESGIRQVAGDEAPVSPRPDREGPQLLPIPLVHQPAVAVAALMYSAYGERAELVRRGPEGLPAFSVHAPDRVDQVQYTVGIDEDENRLLVEGPAHQAE